MRPVHLQGMGLLGSLLAWRLERLNVPFTWHDADAGMTAWKACTGAIYPGGTVGSIDRTCYDWWQEHLIELEDDYPGTTEACGYWFSHKRPPHQGAYEVLRREGPLGLGELPSFHVDAQQLVPASRRYFEHLQRPCAEHDSQLVVAHGFSERMSHAYWGWTRLVRLDIDPQLGVESARSAYYFRKGRFVMAYAYPKPNTDWWYAGSSIIKQRELRTLEVESKYARWRENFEELSGGLVRVREAGVSMEGWRPAQEDPARGVVVRDGFISVPPLWSSGLRHFPRVWRGVARAVLPAPLFEVEFGIGSF